MTCKKARRLFGAYWDDELTQAERDWLEAHFSGCSPCRDEYEALARTLEMVSTLPRPEVPPDFADRVLARARRAAAVPDRLPAGGSRWIPVAAAAGVLVVAAAVALQFPWGGGAPVALRPASESAGLIPQPVLVEPAPAPRSAGTPRVAVPGAPGVGTEVAAIPDTLFDHAEDVEFILDPFTLRKGRAHTRFSAPPAAPRGQQATITF